MSSFQKSMIDAKYNLVKNYEISSLTNCEPQATEDLISCCGRDLSLCNAKEFSTTLIDSGELLVHIWKLDGSLIKFNNYAQNKTGFKEEEVLGDKWINTILSDKDLPGLNSMFKGMKKGQIPPVTECKLYCKNGNYLNVLWSNFIAHDIMGNPYLGISVGMDITEFKVTRRKLTTSYKKLEEVNQNLQQTQKQLKKQLMKHNKTQNSLLRSEEIYNLVQEASNDGIWDLDLENGNKFYYSDRCYEMLGYKKEDIGVLFKSWRELIHPEDYREFEDNLSNYLNKKIPVYRIEYRLRNRNGEYVWILSRGKATWDKNNNPIRIVGCHTSIHERKQSEDKIYKVAYYDEITGLPNRALLLKELCYEIEQAREKNQKVALLSLDIDNFKNINDTLGHHMGDELLRVIGKRVQRLSSDNITAARCGGDEFLVLIKNITDENEVNIVADSLIKIFSEPINLKSLELYPTVSIGGVIYPEDGQDEYTLLKNADIAMYNAKEQNGNKFQLFNNDMNLRIIEKLELENGLREALKNNELCLYYQPQVNIESNEVVGVEALIRWQHPTKGLIPPYKFIPVSEETGIIIQIGEWVLRKACEHFIQWKKANIEPKCIAVNISAMQFEQNNFVSIVKDIIEDTGIDPQYIELEITESIAMKNLEYTIQVINELKALNIKVSLDDFGTGYSSLNYLMRLPINTLKIDKSFLDNIMVNSNEELIAKTIIALAKNMNLSVVAEGVETVNQLKFLKEQNCDIAQGYLFSKPIEESEVRKILIKKK